jgi:threonine/homoserine/homoserine lactone efflux protein
VPSPVVSLAAGVVFGLALAAPPGPMNAVIAEESVLRGWTAGFRAGLGAATADAAFFVLALLGAVTFVRRVPAVEAAMVGVGGALMLYYAYGAASAVRDSFHAGDAADGRDQDAPGDPTGESAGFRKAFVLALTNPYQVVFWLTVGVGLLEAGQVDLLRRLPVLGADLAGLAVVRTGSPALLVGLFVGILVWIVGFPAALVSARRRVERFAPAVAVLSAAVLAGFGFVFLVRAVRTTGVLA